MCRRQSTYQYRASFDGKTWHNGRDKASGKLSFSLPGDKESQRDGQSPGELGAEFNLK